MKRLKMGPELKLPELKLPTFVVDLWWDLWDRRLLPLVALALVAIVAVPVLLSSGSGESTAQTAARQAASAAAVERANSPASTLTVVEENPGLRDYRRRLAHRSPSDPFKQRFTVPAVQPSQSTEGQTSTTGTGSGGGQGTAPAPQPSSGSSSNGGKTGGGATPSPGSHPHLILFTFAINVRITRFGGKNAKPGEKPQSWTEKGVRPLRALPWKKVPAVTYLGTSKGKPALLVSPRVDSISGEGTCLSGEQPAEEGEESFNCQLLEVEPGFPVTFVYGFNEVHFTIKVLAVKLVVIGRTQAPRARPATRGRRALSRLGMAAFPGRAVTAFAPVWGVQSFSK
jgi:hypothetical protein